MGGGHCSLKAKREKKTKNSCPGQVWASQRKRGNRLAKIRELEFEAKKKGITVFQLKRQRQRESLEKIKSGGYYPLSFSFSRGY